MSMDPERLLKLRGFLDRGVRGYLSHKEGAELLKARDDLAREVERLNVRFQHERRAKRSAIMAHRDAKAEAERLRGMWEVASDTAAGLGRQAETQGAELAQLRAEAERLRGERDHLQARCDELAEVLAPYLVQPLIERMKRAETDAPEGEQPPSAPPKMTRRLADLGAADLWKTFRVALTGSGVIHTWEYQGRFEESFGGPEASRFTDENGETHSLHHPDWRVGPAQPEGEQP